MGIVVLIDNGHGAETPGKRSPDGLLLEWRWARGAAGLLAGELAARGIPCRRLVEEDADVPIAARLARARAAAGQARREGGLPVLVSLHVNASGADGRWGRARGWQVHAPTRGEAGRLAESARLGECLLAAVAEEGFGVRRYSAAAGCWPGPFGLLQGADCPAVLTENLFMDTRADLALLLAAGTAERLARAHAAGLARYGGGRC